MNMKNVSLYAGILLLVVIFGLGLELVLIDLQNSPYTIFSDESEQYITGLLSGINTNNLKNVTEKTNAGYQEDNVYLSEEDEGGSSISASSKLVSPSPADFNLLLSVFKFEIL